MKKLFFATSALVALIAIPAGAADLPVKAPVYRPPPPACANFGGGYIGVSGGTTYYDHRFNDLDNFGFNSSVDIDNFGGFTNTDFSGNAGIGGGWNWQWNCAVFGVQLDWNWTNAATSSFHTDSDPAFNITMDSRMKWFATARTRAGVVVDSVLLYVTGGLAWARFDRSNFYNADGDTLAVAFTSTRLGWAFGAGAEWQLNPNWTLGGEFLYMGFKKDEQSFICTGDICPGGLDAFRYRFLDSAFVSRISLNYRWGGFGKYPVTARY
jgi:outer membrane immunogenic protein